MLRGNKNIPVEYKNFYEPFLSEGEVPFSAADVVKKGLATKYGTDDLDAYTFGIELEFAPEGGTDSEAEIDWDSVYADLESTVKTNGDFTNYIDSQRKKSNRNWNGNLDSWDDTYGPVDVDTFTEYNHAPEPDKYENQEEYYEAEETWNNTISDIKTQYSIWERADGGREHLSDYVSDLDASDYLDLGDYTADTMDSTDEIRLAVAYIKDKMHENVVYGGGCNKTTWAVGEDAENIEIRSKHLDQTEFHMVRDICSYVKNRETHGGTSAHVHIGLPKDFDVFDLLAISTLVDERAIKGAVGPGRELSSYAKLRDSLHNILISYIVVLSGETVNPRVLHIPKDKLYSIMYSIDRNHGTNVTSMGGNGTIEFRYFDSTIAKNPEKFISWIKYFLLLPEVAKRRNRILLKGSGDDKRTIVSVRTTSGANFYLDKEGPRQNLPAVDIKNPKPEIPLTSAEKINRLLRLKKSIETQPGKLNKFI